MNPFKHRECDGCTQCCKVVAVPELDKPQDVWCKHCEIGVGCKIQGQPERPEACGKFDCLWLQGLVPEALKPNKSKVVFGMTGDGRRVQAFVPTTTPDIWETGAVRSYINSLVDSGIDVIIICGDTRRMLTNNPAQALVEIQQKQK